MTKPDVLPVTRVRSAALAALIARALILCACLDGAPRLASARAQSPALTSRAPASVQRPASDDDEPEEPEPEEPDSDEDGPEPTLPPQFPPPQAPPVAPSGVVWQPAPGTTWQWQLSGSIDTTLDVQMYDLDLYTTPDAVIAALHAAGRKVMCYFSAGSYEPDRPDSAALAQTGLGAVLDGWPDERWLDVRQPAVREAMRARLDLARSRGCDGVEPDNVDGYANPNGLGLSEQDQLDFDIFLATEAHARQLSIGLKNSLDLVPQLVSTFDWALNEQCLELGECEALTPFIAAGKAVFHCEYAESTSGICGRAPQGFSSIVKRLELDAFRLSCN